MTPLPFTWDGEAMVPAKGFASRADKQFTIGHKYIMETVEERSGISHRHYFAAIADGWSNLPETMADRFPNVEALRKFALIKAGYADSRQFVASSKAEAQRLAAFVRPTEEYAIIDVRDAVVTVYTARSQSMKAMGKAEFQKSKDAVIGVIESLIGASIGEREAA